MLSEAAAILAICVTTQQARHHVVASLLTSQPMLKTSTTDSIWGRKRSICDLVLDSIAYEKTASARAYSSLPEAKEHIFLSKINETTLSKLSPVCWCRDNHSLVPELRGRAFNLLTRLLYASFTGVIAIMLVPNFQHLEAFRGLVGTLR